jgi:hypothetical protein
VLGVEAALCNFVFSGYCNQSLHNLPAIQSIEQNLPAIQSIQQNLPATEASLMHAMTFVILPEAGSPKQAAVGAATWPQPRSLPAPRLVSHQPPSIAKQALSPALVHSSRPRLSFLSIA